MKNLRIEALEATPIALSDPPLLNAAGLHAPYALRIVVELVTESGLTGISEIPGDIEYLDALVQSKPSLLGAPATNLVEIGRRLERCLGSLSNDARGTRSWDRRRGVHVRSAIEVACLDVIGKRLECRVADLLGGVVREEVPFAGYLFFKYEGGGGAQGVEPDPGSVGWAAARRAPAFDARSLVEQARAMVAEHGFSSLKVKAGILEPEVEVAAVLALRDSFGRDMAIRIDPNAAWSFQTALACGKRMEGVIEYLEDPVRGQEQMALLRRQLDIPFATNMCTVGFDDLPSSIALGSEDIILADHHFWGGLRPCMDLARMCQTFGRGISTHSNSHAGISMAAMTQLGAALPKLHSALDTHYPWQIEDVITGGKLEIASGCVKLPEAPGLGVTIDRAALAAAHQRYLGCGLLRRDDEREMQERQPGWQFTPIRY